MELRGIERSKEIGALENGFLRETMRKRVFLKKPVFWTCRLLIFVQQGLTVLKLLNTIPTGETLFRRG
jgi:hypothetical protein